ncbi:MAG TPA: sugar ABC transporter substrate-binding protein [Solirubrobacteraceae bacterium]|nr:sugar ABC transporter substrate-binding protein [Solirubrobacteraceae bacterium]
MRRSVLRSGVACALGAAALALTGCSVAGAGGGAGSGPHGVALRVAIVSNPQMQDVEMLIKYFEREHPNIKVNFVTLPENQSRATVTDAVSTHSNEFDVVMISNYETPMWARYGWITNLQPYIARTKGYDENDFIPSIRKSLSYRGAMYSVPFYGESSFLAYRKDLFAKAGLHMPAHPTWPQVAAFAKKLDDKKKGVAGICLRGDSGWGENLAPLDTVINTFGGRWFNMRWQPQLTSPSVERAVRFYVHLVRNYGEPGPGEAGFSECATNYEQGNAAMWYDATSAAGTLEAKGSPVAGKNGYAPAPVLKTKHSGWLYTWSLAIPKTSPAKRAAWQFISWATSKAYIKLVGRKLGWSNLPPGSRLSTYRIPQYLKAAKAFAKPTLTAIESADPQHPTVKPVPYTGVQFLDIPEFQDLGTRVSQQITAAIAGGESVKSALQASQQYAQDVGKEHRS